MSQSQSQPPTPPLDPARVLAVIPARLASTRLPRKVLRDLNGQPLLAWVVEAALRCPQLGQVVVAADSPEVADLCKTRGWSCLMTSPNLPSGSDRLFAISRELDADIYINIQADEPLLEPAHIEALLLPFNGSRGEPPIAHPGPWPSALGAQVTTLKVRCPPESIADPNVVKVVTAPNGRALYFSRATIPFNRDSHSTPYWKHLGLYAYRKSALARFAAFPPGQLEQTERLEQLRLLENGIDIYVTETPHDTIGVDTEEDLDRVAALLAKSSR
jgi:3-deoxy-manno-octulosonate cytidylyltransferase (CMP-KDO synthetase)